MSPRAGQNQSFALIRSHKGPTETQIQFSSKWIVRSLFQFELHSLILVAFYAQCSCQNRWYAANRDTRSTRAKYTIQPFSPSPLKMYFLIDYLSNRFSSVALRTWQCEGLDHRGRPCISVQTVVTLTKIVTPNAMRQCLRFLYTGQIDTRYYSSLQVSLFSILTGSEGNAVRSARRKGKGHPSELPKSNWSFSNDFSLSVKSLPLGMLLVSMCCHSDAPLCIHSFIFRRLLRVCR